MGCATAARRSLGSAAMGSGAAWIHVCGRSLAMTGDAGVRRTGKPGRRWSFLWILAATLLAGSLDVRAQPGEIGVGEFSAYTGLTAGAVGTQPVLGATSGLSFSKYFIGLFDVSYARLGDD